MSAVAAIVRLDGAPVDASRLRTLTLAMTFRGPHAQATRVRDAGGLGHCLFKTLPEDSGQPVEDAAGSCLLALDGRIDNRSDLAVSARLMARDAASMSDAALLLAAYVEQGDDIFERLLGEFAVLVWDPRRRRFVAARDLFGLRPLYYRGDGNSLLVASTLEALRRAAPVAIDDAMAAEALTGGFASTTGTLFREISRVPPGHLLVADASGVSTHRFIGLTAVESRQDSSEAYGEEFDALLSAAVQCRLRSPDPVGVMLSGGIDSASIYSTARAGTGPAASAVGAFTISSDRTAHDESDVARAVVAAAGGHHCVVPSSAAEFDYQGDTARHGDLPIQPSGANSWNLRRCAAEAGSPVLLIGVGGDEWFGGHRWHQTDLLTSGRWRRLWDAWQCERRRDDGFTTPQFVAQTLMPILPRAVKRIGRAIAGPDFPGWIRRDFADRVGLGDRIRVRPDVVASTFARRGLLIDGLNGWGVHALEEEERLAAASGTENRYPYYDRRLVRFALSLPADLTTVPDTPKRFIRDRFRSRLPASCVDQPLGPDSGFLTCEAIRRLGGRAFFDSLATEAAGWVDGARARRAADQWWRFYRDDDDRYRGFTVDLWSLASVECWLRAQRGDGASFN